MVHGSATACRKLGSSEIFGTPLQHARFLFLPVPLPRATCVHVDLPPDQAPPSNYRVSALQAFWPAVQAAVGDEETAKNTYDILLELWEEYGALPDFFDPLNGR